MVKLHNKWDDLLAEEFQKDYYLKLRAFLKAAYSTRTIYPNMHDIFNALRATARCDTRAVILGQDPYIGVGEAHGMSFSVKKGVRIPPSLRNIFKEICDDVGGAIPEHGCLEGWAQQGVLLLNTCLTVEAGKSKSHSGKGWEKFTTFVIEKLNECENPIVFMLWGNDAKSKKDLITSPAHLVLTAAHPSPLAGGAFFGCKHFSKANEFLKENGRGEIGWQIV